MTTDATALEANYPIVLPMRSERVLRAEMHGAGLGGFPLVMGTWDCECDAGYIHWAARHGGDDHCADCGVYEEDMPESRLYEIADNAANCQVGFMSDAERAVFSAAFEAEGWGELMRVHFATNKAAIDAYADAKENELMRLYH